MALWIILSLFVNVGFSASLTCQEKFPRPMESGCFFERCVDRILPKIEKEGFLFSKPSLQSKKVQAVSSKDQIVKVTDHKSQWVQVGTLEALSDYGSARDAKISWKKGDQVPFVKYESEGLGFQACVEKQRVEFSGLVNDGQDCEAGTPCLKLIDYPKYAVWANVQLKNGRVGWINIESLKTQD